jgi:hypothetical protein
MGKSSSSQPKAPDPGQVAQQQGAANTNTAVANAWLNSPNIVTPWGNVSTTQLGTQTVGGQQIPTFQQTQTLSPEQQKIYEQGVQGDTQLNQLGLDQLGRIKDSVSSPFSMDAFGPAPTGGMEARNRAEQALNDRLNPQIERDQLAMEQRLANQGISLGSEAWRSAQDDSSRARNDARLAVIGQGGAEESRQFGIDQAARNQRISDALMQRERPLAEYAMFTGANNNFQSPGNVSTPQANIAPTDVAGPIYANYQAQLAQQQQRQGANNSLMGAGAGLAGSALGGWASSW